MFGLRKIAAFDVATSHTEQVQLLDVVTETLRQGSVANSRLPHFSADASSLEWRHHIHSGHFWSTLPMQRRRLNLESLELRCLLYGS